MNIRIKMALNKFMHPRNIYKKPPDFKKLALTSAEFRKHIVQELTGRVTIDFKNAEALRCLTVALLKQDFGLDISLPLDRLIPTVPLRLNYILWLEDILDASNQQADDMVKGIDIGTGSSCIYPLLGAKLNNWQFLATDIDDENLTYARDNVEKNQLVEMITVKKTPDDTILRHILNDTTTTYNFCMCNPPFFADHIEAQGLNSRNDDRPEPSSTSTASCNEQIAEGGEIEFVRKMIIESLQLKENIRIFTSMVGKKSSLGPLKEELRKQEVPNFSTTEFCQGKTMRWGIGWSFDKTVVFPKSYFQMKKKDRAPLVYLIPKVWQATQQTVEHVGVFIKQHLDDLKIAYEEQSSSGDILVLKLCAKENTWSHLRRKRRKAYKREITDKKQGEVIPGNSGETTENTIVGDGVLPSVSYKDDMKKMNMKPVVNGCNLPACVNPNAGDSVPTDNCKRNLDNSEAEESESKRQKTQDKQTETAEKSTVGQTVVGNSDINKQGPSSEASAYLFKCQLKLVKVEDQLKIELVWMDGQNKEVMHQVLQYFKNQFNL